MSPAPQDIIPPKRHGKVIDLRQAVPRPMPPLDISQAQRPPQHRRPQAEPARRLEHAYQPRVEPRATAEQVATAPTKRAGRFRLPSFKKIAVVALKILVLVGASYFFLSLSIGLPDRLIGIYFVATLLFAIDSQRTFLVALLFLILVAVISAFQKPLLAENYAIYAFYFLVIGLLSAIREMIFVKTPK